MNVDTNDDRRTDVTGTFVTHRSTEQGDEAVWHLTIDTGTEHRSVFLTPARSDVRFDLLTGREYTFDGVRVCAPAATETVDDVDCPACGSGLREWTAVDDYPAVRAALSEFDVDGEFYVVDTATTFDAPDDDRSYPVDDWRPWRTTTPPGLVCVDCDREFDSREFRLPTDDAHPTDAVENYSVAPTESIGLAAGGANDVSNFRENVANGYTPQPDALAPEGLFHDYRFPTRGDTAATGLFVPTCSQSVSTTPLTGDEERYLAVGLDSSLPVSEFERPPLDLVAVLDVSGSMQSGFDEYYYDETGTRREVRAEERSAETKLEAATESLCALTRHLAPDDRFGVVLYNGTAHVAKPLGRVDETDLAAIRGHIRDVQAGGGTDMGAGFGAARDLLADAPEDEDEDRERRIVFTTDAMPNTGITGSAALTDLVADAADERIHTTFVGMGIDANAELTSDLSAVRGANHYFVHSSAAFERRLGEEFDYVVSPLAFDLSVDVDVDGHRVTGVYGSPNADPEEGRAIHVETLFPSPPTDGESRGGVVLVRLDSVGAVADDAEVRLHASWTERDGTEDETTVTVPLRDEGHEDAGVRKAVALTRYARTLREWTERVRNGGTDELVDDWRSREGKRASRRTRHERGSVPLRVSSGDATTFEELASYLREERDAVDDPSLSRELDVLKTLQGAARETEARR
jgi:Ca-activated chloride channel family protein